MFNVIFPDRCFACGCLGKLFCSNCRKQLKENRCQRCFVCGRKSELGETCRRCSEEFLLDALCIAFNSRCGVFRKLIYDYKYGGNLRLARYLVARMKFYLESLNKGQCDITWVPMFVMKKFLRGYDQAQVLANSLGSPRVKKLLKRTRWTRSQTGLNKSQRFGNVRDVFLCRAKPSDVVIIVDDIVTTGSSIGACARQLKMAGAKQVYGLVLGRGIR